MLRKIKSVKNWKKNGKENTNDQNNKEMKLIFSTILMMTSLLSCSQKTTEVHKVNPSQKKTPKIKIVNKVDPICNMEVDGTVKDTAMYQGKAYGFCNPMCKQEFKKSPKKYIK